jgi:hypothetical protein
MFLDLGIKPAYPRTPRPAPHGFSPFCAVCGCDFCNPQGCGAVPKKEHLRPRPRPMLSPSHGGGSATHILAGLGCLNHPLWPMGVVRPPQIGQEPPLFFSFSFFSIFFFKKKYIFYYFLKILFSYILFFIYSATCQLNS